MVLSIFMLYQLFFMHIGSDQLICQIGYLLQFPYFWLHTLEQKVPIHAAKISKILQDDTNNLKISFWWNSLFTEMNVSWMNIKSKYNGIFITHHLKEIRVCQSKKMLF